MVDLLVRTPAAARCAMGERMHVVHNTDYYLVMIQVLPTLLVALVIELRAGIQTASDGRSTTRRAAIHSRRAVFRALRRRRKSRAHLRELEQERQEVRAELLAEGRDPDGPATLEEFAEAARSIAAIAPKVDEVLNEHVVQEAQSRTRRSLYVIYAVVGVGFMLAENLCIYVAFFGASGWVPLVAGPLVWAVASGMSLLVFLFTPYLLRLRPQSGGTARPDDSGRPEVPVARSAQQP